MSSKKNYRLAKDENGSPFVLNSKGSIDFGYITEEMNLPPAPIRLPEGVGGEKGYGLLHIEERRIGQIRSFGFKDVKDFVEYVCSCFTDIKEGAGNSYLLELGDRYRNTLYISLSRDGDYWKVISGGIFRLKYSQNKKITYSASEVQSPQSTPEVKV